MEQLLTTTNRIITDKSEITVQYSLWVTKETSEMMQYGVSLTDTNAGETVLVKDLTGNRLDAERFYESLIRGNVTPVSLKELAEDFVCTS